MIRSSTTVWMTRLTKPTYKNTETGGAGGPDRIYLNWYYNELVKMHSQQYSELEHTAKK